jgi:hypothetical protein
MSFAKNFEGRQRRRYIGAIGLGVKGVDTDEAFQLIAKQAGATTRNVVLNSVLVPTFGGRTLELQSV